MVRRRATLGLVAVVLALACTACGSGGPVLTSHPNSVVEGAPRIHQGDTVTIGGMFACLDESGSVTVKTITAVNPTGLQVTEFGIRPNPSWKRSPTTGMGQLGVSRKTLSELQFPTSRVVDVKCGKNGEGVEFGLEVRKITRGEAGLSAIRVTYTSGGETKTFTFPLAVRLCNEEVAWAKRCRALEV